MGSGFGNSRSGSFSDLLVAIPIVLLSTLLWTASVVVVAPPLGTAICLTAAGRPLLSRFQLFSGGADRPRMNRANSGRRIGRLVQRMATSSSASDHRAVLVFAQVGSGFNAPERSVGMRIADIMQTLEESQTNIKMPSLAVRGFHSQETKTQDTR